jgi:hypothetical protein
MFGPATEQDIRVIGDDLDGKPVAMVAETKIRWSHVRNLVCFSNDTKVRRSDISELALPVGRSVPRLFTQDRLKFRNRFQTRFETKKQKDFLHRTFSDLRSRLDLPSGRVK